MKKYLILTLLISIQAISQNCKIKTNTDAFNKITTSKIMQNNLSSGLACDFYKFRKEEITTYYLSFFGGNISPQCLTSNSKVYFLFSDDEVLEIPYIGEIKCGKTSIEIKLDEEQIKYLLSKELKQIRLFIETSYDYKLSEKKNLEFKKNLDCLISN